MALFNPEVTPVLGNFGVVVAVVPVQVVGTVIVLWSRVTAAVSASTLPCREAPVFRLSDE